MIVWKVEMMYISPITWEKKWVLYGHTTTRAKARELTRAVRDAGQWDGTRVVRVIVWS